MGTVFKAERSVWVDASKIHGKGAEYYIAIGREQWGEDESEGPIVLKIQMAYDRKRCGRKCTSYPLDADDWERVSEAANKIIREYTQ